jgi:Permuted papain-like amidase enzyme, YaeF/YiiX, C92 family
VTQASFEDEIVRDFGELRALAEAPVFTSDDIVRNVSRIYHDVHERDLGRYSRADLKAVAPLVMSEMFHLRNVIRDRVADWHARGLMTREAQHAVRDTLRVLRYASDMAGEVHWDYLIATDTDPALRAFSEHSYNTFVHPAFDAGVPLAFRSGDVLLVRGMKNNSAAIARIGDVDSQFSHAAIVYVDELGRGSVVEALIEQGAVINPLKDVLEHGLARAMLFRHRDEELAARAARLIHDYVKRSVESGTPILYDFSMRLGPSNKLFCSKLVRVAYDDASEGKLRLPAFLTHFNANAPFYRSIGVKAAETFAPGDLEIDPAFDLVAEWQDYRTTAQVRHQDMIMTKLFEWMEVHGYRFREDFSIKLIARLGRFSTKLSRRVQDLVANLFARIPPHMPRRTIATIVMLQKTAQPLLEDIQHQERVRIAAEGKPLHPREVFDYLEDVRRRNAGQVGYLVAPRKWRHAFARSG